MTGGLRLRSNITLHFLENAVLYGSRNAEDYDILKNDIAEPFENFDLSGSQWSSPWGKDLSTYSYEYISNPLSRWNNSVIRIINAENIKIIGEEGSIICGRNCYDPLGEEEYRGPHGIGIHNSKNIVLEGYSVKDSGNWAHMIYNSENISAKNLTVLAGHDGFHIRGCKNVTLTDSGFYTGDDCIAGFANTNVYVHNCILNTACSGLRFGGTNAVFDSCKFFGPGKYLFRGSLTIEERKSCADSAGDNSGAHRTNMLSAFTYLADASHKIDLPPSNIIISNSMIKCVDRLIHYNFSGNEIWQNARPLESLEMKNITAEEIRMPVNLYGDEKNPLSFKMTDCSISLKKDFEYDAAFYICNYKNICFKNVSINNTPKKLICIWSDNGKINTDGILCDMEPEQRVAYADKPFETIAI